MSGLPFFYLLEDIVKSGKGVELQPRTFGLFPISFINSSELVFEVLLEKKVKSSFFDFFACVLVGNGPGFCVVGLFPDPHVKVPFDVADNFAGVILLFEVEVLNVLGH